VIVAPNAPPVVNADDGSGTHRYRFLLRDIERSRPGEPLPGAAETDRAWRANPPLSALALLQGSTESIT
jgi:hypothetical protein